MLFSRRVIIGGTVVFIAAIPLTMSLFAGAVKRSKMIFTVSITTVLVWRGTKLPGGSSAIRYLKDLVVF